MTVIYETPDRGKTIYARHGDDYATRWRVDPPRQALRGTASALTDAAGLFGRIEQAAAPRSAKAP
ncbi:hypothetical protein [Azospirillum sp.]|uniref:hypothetical protein n=1 Tax=Azospirillum sp. TaxID=34012 RepID=UPI003D7035DD